MNMPQLSWPGCTANLSQCPSTIPKHSEGQHTAPAPTALGGQRGSQVPGWHGTGRLWLPLGSLWDSQGESCPSVWLWNVTPAVHYPQPLRGGESQSQGVWQRTGLWSQGCQSIALQLVSCLKCHQASQAAWDKILQSGTETTFSMMAKRQQSCALLS